MCPTQSSPSNTAKLSGLSAFDALTRVSIENHAKAVFWPIGVAIGGKAAMPEFDLKVALIIFVTKVIDPFAALPALVAGYFCRTWWQVVISAAAVGIFVEMVLVLFEPTPGIHQGRLLMAVLAAGVWSNLAFAFKTWRAKRA
jgi:hypothetical protein